MQWGWLRSTRKEGRAVASESKNPRLDIEMYRKLSKRRMINFLMLIDIFENLHLFPVDLFTLPGT